MESFCFAVLQSEGKIEREKKSDISVASFANH